MIKRRGTPRLYKSQINKSTNNQINNKKNCIFALVSKNWNIKMSEFESLLPFKVEGIVEQLIEGRKMSLQDALKYLYSSQLYALLEREETKMWYYSPQMLLHLLDNEKNTGKLTLPQ